MSKAEEPTDDAVRAILNLVDKGYSDDTVSRMTGVPSGTVRRLVKEREAKKPKTWRP